MAVLRVVLDDIVRWGFVRWHFRQLGWAMLVGWTTSDKIRIVSGCVNTARVLELREPRPEYS